MEEPNKLPLFTEAEIAESISADTRALMAAFNDGYLNGYYWPDCWETHGRPGGPWTYTGRDKAKAEQSGKENALWRDGWRQGHDEKLNANRSVTVEEHKEKCRR